MECSAEPFRLVELEHQDFARHAQPIFLSHAGVGLREHARHEKRSAPATHFALKVGVKFFEYGLDLIGVVLLLPKSFERQFWGRGLKWLARHWLAAVVPVDAGERSVVLSPRNDAGEPQRQAFVGGGGGRERDEGKSENGFFHFVFPQKGVRANSLDIKGNAIRGIPCTANVGTEG